MPDAPDRPSDPDQQGTDDAGTHPGPTHGLGGMQAGVDAGTTPGSAGAGAGGGQEAPSSPGRRPEDIGPPGSQGAGLGGRMDAGPDAGSGPGVPQDLDAETASIVEGRRSGGPAGSQDSGGGDLAEAGD